MKQKENTKKNSDSQSKKFIFVGLIFIIFALVLSNVWALGFYKPKMAQNENSEIDKYNFLNPARKYINQEDLIINFQPLRDYLNDKYEADPNVSVYFEYLPTGASIAINKDAEFYPASLLKVPVAMAVAKKIEKGEWKWTNELVLMPTDKDEKFGTLYKEPSNSTHTIEELVNRSLSDSDNSAHFMLVRNLEMEEMKDVYDHMGLEGFLETEGSLSAKRYSVMMRALYNSSYNTEDNSQKLLSYLSQSPFDDYLQTGLSKDVSFAHKIGVDGDKKIYLDSGIIYAKDRPYLLTVMTKNKDEQTAKKIMADISEKVYNYVIDFKE